MATKKTPKRRSTRKRSATPKSRKFDRGCCLSGCLCYFGCGSVVLIILCLLSFGIFAQLAAKIAPEVKNYLSAADVLKTLNMLPMIGIAIGVVDLLLVYVVWRGYRWGVYGLVLIAAVGQVMALWGAGSLSEAISAFMSTAYNNIPLIVLILLLRPKWKQLR